MADHAHPSTLRVDTFTVRGAGLDRDAGTALARRAAEALARRLPGGTRLDSVTLRLTAGALRSDPDGAVAQALERWHRSTSSKDGGHG